MCLYPRLITNPKYKSNKKNGGNVPVPTDPRTTQIPVGCGKCIECMKQRARNWQIRLQEEIRHTPHGKFVTLTFNNEQLYELTKLTHTKGYTQDNEIATIAVRRFLERWRKSHMRSLRHWLVTELGHGKTEHIHLHGLIWYDNNTDHTKLQAHWQYGYTFQGHYVNEHTIAYISKYINKIDLQHKHYKPIILTSKNPGIGHQYINRPDARRNAFNETGETTETYRTRTGHNIALPIYYRNKIYNDQQKETLWLQKLDKQKRYILGNEIDTSNTHDNYLNALQQARQKNTQLGYGSDKIDYNQKHYENQIRLQKQMTRIINEKQKIIDKQIKIITKTNIDIAPF